MAEFRFIEDDNIERITTQFFNKCKAFLIRCYKPVDNSRNGTNYISTYSIFTAVQKRHPSRLYKECNVERWLQELNFQKRVDPGVTSKYWKVKSH